MNRVLRLDMHVHTSFSHDGWEPPTRMVERAVEIGLDGLAITDHNTQAGVGEALDAGRGLGVVVIPGVEVSCREGHVLLYGSGELELRRGQGVGDLLAQMRDECPFCMAAPAHPFDRHRSGMGWQASQFAFQAVETVNAHSPLPRGAVLPLARKLGVGELGGSDTHVLEGLGKGRTVVAVDDGDILSAVGRSGRAEGGFHPWSILVPVIRRWRQRSR